MNTNVTQRVVFPGTRVLCFRINNGHPAWVHHYDARQHFDSQSCVGCGTHEHCQPVAAESSCSEEDVSEMNNSQSVSAEQGIFYQLSETRLLALISQQCEIILLLLARQAIYCPGYNIEGTRARIATKFYSPANKTCQACSMNGPCHLVRP